MIRRRQFLGLLVGGIAGGCVVKAEGVGAPKADAALGDENAPDSGPGDSDARPAEGSPDAEPVDPCADVDTVSMYDTNAQALYSDNTFGPLTGVIKADYVLQNQPVTLEFWHGHGGSQHRFTIGPEEFAQLKKGERVYVTTDMVEGHDHRLFIDPSDLNYRVSGAQPVEVPIEDC